MLRIAFATILLWVISLTAWVALIGVGEYGASPWLVVPLLLWLISLGAPTALAVLLIVWLWPGGSFLAFVSFAAVAALVAQFVAVVVAIRLFQRFRRRRRHENQPA